MQRFEQRLVNRAGACVVTLLEATPLPRPLRIDGAVALEPGAPAVWFTFPGAWHDIGRFHDASGGFTGLYANILTPVEDVAGLEWCTTDLFLDLWLPAAGGPPRLLDAAELEEAVAAGLDVGLAAAARREAARLMAAAAAGTWPPPVVHEWTLERARRAVHGGTWHADPV